MITYQDHVLNLLEQDAEKVSINIYTGDQRKVQVTRVSRFANCGRVLVHHPDEQRTLATLDFDFQTGNVRISVNESKQVGQPNIGPRRLGIYWWVPGHPEDDGELVRLRTDWVGLIQHAVMSGLSPEHGEHYAREIGAIQ